MTMFTRLVHGDPRAGDRQTVEQWLRGEQGGAWVREGDTVVTLDEWTRGQGDPKEFTARLMPAINRWAKKDLGTDDVLVRGSYVCNTERDYYYSRFGRPALAEAAEMIVGQPKMRMHNYRTGEPEGKTFDAEVVLRKEPGKPTRDSYWLKTLWYTLANDDGKRLIERVDGGLDDQVSISWGCAGADCSECGDPIYSCRHIPGDIYSKGICDFEFSGLTRVLEDSFVFQGGQKNTTNFIPEGERAAPAAAVAVAVNRYLDAMTGDLAWDRIASAKRDFLMNVGGMPREIRAAAEVHRRAVGMGTLCAEPGERRNTQSLVLSKERFKSEAAAARYVRDHDFRADRRSQTADAYEFAILDAKKFEKGSIAERALDPGVVARIGAPKAQDEQSTRDGARGGAVTDDASPTVARWLAGASR